MPYSFRRVRNYFTAQLSAAATLSATTLSSPDFAGLPDTYTTDQYLPLELHDPTLKVMEVIWVVGHATGSTDVTIERGKETTIARAWPSGTQVVCAPTIRDGGGPIVRSGLPTDAWIGERHTVLDESFPVVRTASGWAADVGVAMPSEYGKKQDGSAIPNSAPIQMRGGLVTVSTVSGGALPVTYATPFPTATLHPTVTWVSGGAAPFFNIGVLTGTSTNAGFSAHLYRGDTGGPSAAGTSVTFFYQATGY